MTIIKFEGIADDGEFAVVSNGYHDLLWTRFLAVDDDVNSELGTATVIHSGEASATNIDEKPASFRSPDRDDDFDFSSGYFAALNTNNLQFKVIGFDDGERVAIKSFTLDTNQHLVTFGRKFNDIDEVKIAAKGGTEDSDPTDNFPPFQQFAVDDLFLHF